MLQIGSRSNVIFTGGPPCGVNLRLNSSATSHKEVRTVDSWCVAAMDESTYPDHHTDRQVLLQGLLRTQTAMRLKPRVDVTSFPDIQ